MGHGETLCGPCRRCRGGLSTCRGLPCSHPQRARGLPPIWFLRDTARTNVLAVRFCLGQNDTTFVDDMLFSWSAARRRVASSVTALLRRNAGATRHTSVALARLPKKQPGAASGSSAQRFEFTTGGGRASEVPSELERLWGQAERLSSSARHNHRLGGFTPADAAASAPSPGARGATPSFAAPPPSTTPPQPDELPRRAGHPHQHDTA